MGSISESDVEIHARGEVYSIASRLLAVAAKHLLLATVQYSTVESAVQCVHYCTDSTVVCPQLHRPVWHGHQAKNCAALQYKFCPTVIIVDDANDKHLSLELSILIGPETRFLIGLH